MNLLVGANTFANLKENPKHAFRLLSQAYGLIYASQFARNVQGQPLSLIHILSAQGNLRNQNSPGTLSQRKNTVIGTFERDFDINPFAYALGTVSYTHLDVYKRQSNADTIPATESIPMCTKERPSEVM